MDLKALYKDNEKFKEYVDKYANKANISADEALTHVLVKEYANQCCKED